VRSHGVGALDQRESFEVVAREEKCDTELQRRVALDAIARSLGEAHRAACHARGVVRRAGPE
jgi:hypothetical protein